MSHTISWWSLAWCLLPVLLVLVIYVTWRGRPSELLIASARMFLQLIAVGYVLVFFFNNPDPWISLGVLVLMLLVASWIAIRPVRQQPGIWWPALFALGSSVALHLAISLGLVLSVEHWFEPRILIPLAGMYFANTMNGISLAAERYYAQRCQGDSPDDARITAFHAAMIPQINGLLAVGLVALPGMMTGQILSGVSPLIAVRYQILIMTMVLGSGGLGVAMLLWQLSRKELGRKELDRKELDRKEQP